MGIMTKGILGGFSGLVGTVVGANFRGKDVIRSRPKASGKAPTEKQMLQQAKFKLVVTFLQPLKAIQNKYFGALSGAKSRANIATSYTLNNGLEVVAGAPRLLFNKILITKGDLAGFQNLVATAKTDHKIEMTWEDNSTQANANAQDLVSAVCYCEEFGSFEFFTNIEIRENVIVEFALPDLYAGARVHLWAYLTNSQETSACNSSYLGLITVL